MTEEVTPEEQWRADGIRWGIIAGSAVVTTFALVYFIQRPLVLSRGLWLGTGLIYVAAMWWTQSKVVSDEVKPYIQPGFMVFVVANAIFYLYYHMLFSVFDPELVQLQAGLLQEGGQKAEDAVAPTLGGTFFAYAQSLIFGFVIASVIGFVLSRFKRT
jgi:hypothetical protein